MDSVLRDLTEDKLEKLGLAMGEAILFKKEVAKQDHAATALAVGGGGVASSVTAFSAVGGGGGAAAAAAALGSLSLTASRHNHLQPLLQTKYRGVIDIVSGPPPSLSCTHCMLHQLTVVLTEVVRMPFIVQECTRKVESLLPSASAAAATLPPDMAFAIVAYSYDLGLSSATDDGRCARCLLSAFPCMRPHNLSPPPPPSSFFQRQSVRCLEQYAAPA